MPILACRPSQRSMSIPPLARVHLYLRMLRIWNAGRPLHPLHQDVRICYYILSMDYHMVTSPPVAFSRLQSRFPSSPFRPELMRPADWLRQVALRDGMCVDVGPYLVLTVHSQRRANLPVPEHLVSTCASSVRLFTQASIARRYQ